jgi:hypothetical protein
LPPLQAGPSNRSTYRHRLNATHILPTFLAMDFDLGTVRAGPLQRVFPAQQSDMMKLGVPTGRCLPASVWGSFMHKMPGASRLGALRLSGNCRRACPCTSSNLEFLWRLLPVAVPYPRHSGCSAVPSCLIGVRHVSRRFEQ